MNKVLGIGIAIVLAACAVPTGVTRDAQSAVRSSDQSCQRWMWHHHRLLKHLDHLMIAPQDTQLIRGWKPLADSAEQAFWLCRQNQDESRAALRRSEEEVRNLQLQASQDSSYDREVFLRSLKQKLQQ
jgi:hypothetical protein